MQNNCFRIVYCLIIGFFLATLSYAEQTANIVLENFPSEHVEAQALLKSSIKIENTSFQNQTYQLTIQSPSNWNILNLIPQEIEISPQDYKRIRLIISLSNSTINEDEFKVTLTNTQDPSDQTELSKTVHIKTISNLKIIPPSTSAVAVSPKTKVTYAFQIINETQMNERVELSAEAFPLSHLELSPGQISLQAHEQKEVLITMEPPLNEKVTQVKLKLKATSLKVEPGKTINSYLTIPLYHQHQTSHLTKWSTELNLHLSGFGTGGRITPQTSIKTEARLNDPYYTKITYKGPYQGTQVNARIISKEYMQVEFGTNQWRNRIGDMTVNLGRLSKNFSGRGLSWAYETPKQSALLFELSDTTHQKQTHSYGFEVSTQIQKHMRYTFNTLWERDRFRNPSGPEDDRENNRILKQMLDYTHNGYQWQLGHALSHNRKEEISDQAWFINTKKSSGRLSYNAEYLDFGGDFSGFQKDRRGYTAYANYLLSPEWSLWGEKIETHNNTNRRSDLSTTTNNQNAVGLSWQPTTTLLLETSFHNNKTNSHLETPTSKNHENSYQVSVQKNIAKGTLSYERKWSNIQNIVTVTDDKKIQDHYRYTHRLGKTNLSLGYIRSKTTDQHDHSETINHTNQVGLSTPFLFNSQLSFNGSRSYTENSSKVDHLSLSLQKSTSSDVIYLLEGELSNDHDINGEEWTFWLTRTARFDTFIPGMKTNYIIEGVTFIDQNNNGLLDPNEPSLPHLKLLFNENNSTHSGDQGRYQSPPLSKDIYQVSIDPKSIPFGHMPAIALPQSVNLQSKSRHILNIPFVQSSELSGIIFNDLNQNGEKDPEESGSYQKHITLKQNGITLMHTFSDNSGQFLFKNLSPGTYELWIDPSWLPPRHRVTSAESQIITLNSGDQIQNVSFGIYEQPKKVIKTTFNQQSKKI